MLGMVVFSTIIAITTFLAGLEIVGPTNAAMLSTLEPVVTVLLAAWLFGERLTSITLIGGGLILAAVIVLTRAELKKENINQPGV
jgi:drug/metabolite transporter (DMT)-like permease